MIMCFTEGRFYANLSSLLHYHNMRALLMMFSSSAMGKTATIHADDHPDELRRKLALLGSSQDLWYVSVSLFVPEGDRKAFLESSKMKQEQNEESIKNLRKKNKHLIARLKAVKVSALDSTLT